MKIKITILITLLFYSYFASAKLLYETEKIRDHVSVNPSYSKFDPHGKVDDYLEFINKTNPAYTLSFYDDSSSICPNWFMGIKKSNDKSPFILDEKDKSIENYVFSDAGKRPVKS